MSTSEIRVDWLSARGAGRVGLTIAPGKRQTGAFSGVRHERDLAVDLERLRDADGIAGDVLVSLLEPAEYAVLGISEYHQEVRRHGFELLELAIRDGDVPTSTVDDLVAQIAARLRAGKNVVIHCAGGLGRSGVIGGCLLVHQGATAAEALAALRACRGDRCPETERQREHIGEFAARPSRASRIRGAVLGAAIGDAMGHPTEFMSLPAIHQRFGPDGVRGYELWWERDGRRFAPYTDDTQMAEVVLDSLVVAIREGLDLDSAMRRMGEGFVAWMNAPHGGHRAPGNACLAGCRALEAGTSWREAGGETAGGCGSVMRAYPFGLLFDPARAESWAVEHSKLTHRDPIALAACAAMAVGMAHVMAEAPPDAVVVAMVEAAARYSRPTSEMIQRGVDEAEQGVEPRSPSTACAHGGPTRPSRPARISFGGTPTTSRRRSSKGPTLPATATASPPSPAPSSAPAAGSVACHRRGFATSSAPTSSPSSPTRPTTPSPEPSSS